MSGIHALPDRVEVRFLLLLHLFPDSPDLNEGQGSHHGDHADEHHEKNVHV
jgi:hypothetical protein